MPISIRPLSEEERFGSYYLGQQAFGGGGRDKDWQYDPDPDPTDTYGVYDEQGLQAQVGIRHFQIYLGPKVVVSMGGVAGVSCLPASRGKGYIGKALAYSLEQMRDKGQVVSTLFPFSWDFYRGHGWEWVGLDRRYTIPSRIFKSDPNVENIRAARPDDRTRIIDCYTKFSGNYRGMIQRTEKHWNDILNDGDKKFTYTYLYENNGAVEGYLNHHGWDGKKTDLSEFICLTPQAQRAFLALLRRQEMQMEKFRWHAPDDDTLFHQYYHWDIETILSPKCQGRVVDVAGALHALKPEAGRAGAFTFAVRDEQAPWNAGTWQVEVVPGTVHVKQTSHAPQLSLDIQALSQAYFGTPTVAQLRHAERLTVHDEAGFLSFQRLFNGPPMWMNDSF